MFVPINIPLGESRVMLRYATSEVLMVREWRVGEVERTVVVLYGKGGVEGEFRVEAVSGRERGSGNGGLEVLDVSEGVSVHDASKTAPQQQQLTPNSEMNRADTNATSTPEANVTTPNANATTTSTVEEEAKPTTAAAPPVERRATTEIDRVFVYKHVEGRCLSILMSVGGRQLQFFILDTATAGKTWIVPTSPTSELLLLNADLVTFPSPSAPSTSFRLDQIPTHDTLLTISPTPPTLTSSNLQQSSPFNKVTLMSEFKVKATDDGDGEEVRISMEGGIVRSDVAEADPAYNDKSEGWISVGDTLDYIEKYNISGGTVWYRGEVNLTESDLNPHAGHNPILEGIHNLFGSNKTLPFYADSASDFVSLYINGHYILTLFPLGTEIDSTNRDAYMSFSIPRTAWRVGRNVIAMRVE
ncbi:hypothetical protein HK102_010904, partial [Quaeritorhiza haematococci]